ncbi:MAG: sigma 54-interacting transcriptional regulator [Spirochaetes bacterium]|nr:sigma 54-interacting transcriptional regulator [Spirochaetota bacterium]
MNTKKFKIDEFFKKQVNCIPEIDSIETDEPTFNILTAYSKIVKNQNEEINNLKQYKEREISAFSIGDAIADGICLVDKNHKVLAVNKVYSDITGVKEEDLLGNDIRTLIERGYTKKIVSMMVMEQKKTVTILSTITSNNDKKVLISGTPFFDRKGEIKQVLTVMRDMTELIKLKEKLEKLEKESEKYLNELNYFRNKGRRKDEFIGENSDILKLKELINYIARTDATILISGETGTGKEILAREIHNRSDRSNAPYIKVNCAAIPDSLIESELFGYAKGAFTGAQNIEKPGMFEMANNGTILLDEISEMPIHLQSKLLRVLQEKEIIKVGATKSTKLDVRVIAATNQDLHLLIKQGKFRDDLYYRLNVVPVRIPPLRERKDDIPILAYSFLEKFNRKYRKEKIFDNPAIEALEDYEWPGNVRELENVMERLLVIDNDKYITGKKISAIIGKKKSNENTADYSVTLKEVVDNLEKEMIETALIKHGSTYKAARALGLTQPTVFRKAKAFGIKYSNS